MTMLCNMFCPSDLQREMGALHTSQNKVSQLKNSIDEVDRDDEDVERTWGKDDGEGDREVEQEEIVKGDMIMPEVVRVEVDAV